VQGLASLRSLPQYLDKVAAGKDRKDSIASALQFMVEYLNTPLMSRWSGGISMVEKLRCMDTWEQQDAQEYFGKVLDGLDKEEEKARKQGQARTSPGMEVEEEHQDEKSEETKNQNEERGNPIEGTVAQRLRCLTCGHTEGISLTPFNCLTVTMPGSPTAFGSNFLGVSSFREAAHLDELLDGFCEAETVDEVLCPLCTAVQYRQWLTARLRKLEALSEPGEEKRSMMVKLLGKRLRMVEEMIKGGDLGDEKLYGKGPEALSVPKEMQQRVKKVKEVGVGRPPRALILHVNRSEFDEMTGQMRKNHRRLIFPEALDLGPWTVPSANTTKSKHENHYFLRGTKLTPSRWQYSLRAVVSHAGGHGYGHYVCRRRYPSVTVLSKTTGKPQVQSISEESGSEWWNLSDTTVYPASENDVLNTGNVFMLFYELVDQNEMYRRIAAGTELPASDEEKEKPETNRRNGSAEKINHAPKNGMSTTDKIRALGERKMKEEASRRLNISAGGAETEEKQTKKKKKRKNKSAKTLKRYKA
jgi:ubiquitin carboxyl-terminal hydrolase 1